MFICWQFKVERGVLMDSRLLRTDLALWRYYLWVDISWLSKCFDDVEDNVIARLDCVCSK